MRWFPAITIDNRRYVLPRSRSVANAVSAALIRRSAGDRPAAIATLRAAIASDPPLAIFLAHQTAIHEAEPITLASHQLATRSIDQLARWFQAGCTRDEPSFAADAPGCTGDASGDASGDAPNDVNREATSDAAVAAVFTPLRRQFASLPHADWFANADVWLCAVGQPVAQRNADPVGCWSVRQNVLTDDISATSMPPIDDDPLRILAAELQTLDDLRGEFASQIEREKNAALGELAYGLSHEINNPLTNIATRAEALIGAADTTGDPNLVDDVQDRDASLGKIVDQSYRAFGMIADLMFYARPPSPQIESMDLAMRVREVASEFGTASLNVQVAAAGSMPIEADPTMVGEAIRQLIRNAADAVGPVGTIHVGLSKNSAGAVITIADSGPGLTEKDRRHATDPFYSGREAGRGLGIGLCKASRIAQLHGGKICLDSAVVGCVATLRLPIG